MNDRTRLSIGFGAQRYYIFLGLVFLHLKLLIKQDKAIKTRKTYSTRFFLKHFVFLLLLYFGVYKQ